MSPRCTGAAFLIALTLTAAAAHAERRRVALVNATPALESSARIALSPWELDVIPVEAPSPGDSLPGALSHARDLALAQGVDAVVWISEGGQKYVLWLYDLRTQQIVSRELIDPAPADMPGAAALALTLKTLFRSSTMTGDAIEDRPAPLPPAVTGQTIEQRPNERAAVGGLRLEASGAARMSGGSDTELRLGLAVGYWPRVFERHLGVTLGVSAGPGVAVANSDFTGRFTDFAIASNARARAVIIDHFTIQPSFGASMHVTVLDGAVSAPAMPLHTTRIDPSLDTAITFAFEIGPRLELGVRAGASYLLRYQRYLVDDRVIVSLPPLALDVGLVASAAFN
jgi:hypothetical protein